MNSRIQLVVLYIQACTEGVCSVLHCQTFCMSLCNSRAKNGRLPLLRGGQNLAKHAIKVSEHEAVRVLQPLENYRSLFSQLITEVNRKSLIPTQKLITARTQERCNTLVSRIDAITCISRCAASI